jgi:hypothetical protein
LVIESLCARHGTWELADGQSTAVDLRTVQELLGRKVISIMVRYAHLAPKRTLAAVELLDQPIGSSSDTTTDTRVVQQLAAQPTVLQ